MLKIEKRKWNPISLLSVLVILASVAFSQSTFEFHLEDVTSQHVDIDSTAAFDALVTNTTDEVIQIAFVRTINDLPDNWSSSMCVGTFCYASFIDSTTKPFNPGESMDFIVDIFANVNEGTANVQISIFDLVYPDDKVITDYMATTDPLSIDQLSIVSYKLLDAYPNPFNPSTTISYQLPEPSTVNLVVYNINGQLVEQLVDGRKEIGYHEIVWDAEQYPSGMYFVVLNFGNKVKTKMLTLLK